MSEIKKIFSYRKYWASRFGTAPLLPMSLEEMEDLGWDSCDIIIVTGDAYVDHPSFGMAIIGRLLEAQGFRVGIIAQPDWRSAEDFRRLGRPNLFFGVTSGNMDSMVNRYTADRKIRSDDAYTPDAEAGRRPDRATVAYANRCREAFHGIPVIIGGIETSLRRIAHYDYWSDKVRRSILFDSKADLLVYGNAERQIVEIAHRLARGESIDQIRNLRGTAFVVNSVPEGYQPLDRSHLGDASVQAETGEERSRQIVILPSYEDVHDHRHLYAHASRIMHLETNPGNARAMLQAHGDRYVMVNPPPLPLLTEELDRIYELPFTRRPHPSYGERRIPAYEMIRFSVNIMRGCFGGCTFCSITEHEGRIIQNRSPASIVREIETIRDTVPGFTGIISDIGQHVRPCLRKRANAEELPEALVRPSQDLPPSEDEPCGAHPALPARAGDTGSETGLRRIGPPLRSRGPLARVHPRAHRPPRGGLSEDRAGAHRAGGALEDDEARDRIVLPVSRTL
jgi:uncharacterized radical SAM protein YgiQ